MCCGHSKRQIGHELPVLLWSKTIAERSDMCMRIHQSGHYRFTTGINSGCAIRNRNIRTNRFNLIVIDQYRPVLNYLIAFHRDKGNHQRARSYAEKLKKISPQ